MTRPLYSEDGGHCMTFRDFDGNLWLSFHHPNRNPDERPKFLPLAEDELMSPRPIDPNGEVNYHYCGGGVATGSRDYILRSHPVYTLL